MKSVKISIDLFTDMYMYHVLGRKEAAERIRDGLTAKVEAMARHDDFTKYRTAQDDAGREEARLRYLDRSGIPEDFRR